MRLLLWILAGCGVLYLIGRSWGTAADLKLTLEAVGREVDSLEGVVRDLRSENEPSVRGDRRLSRLQ